MISYHAPSHLRQSHVPSISAGSSQAANTLATNDAATDLYSIRSVLVPLDGTNLGEHAVPYALSVAKRAGAVLHLVHVHARLDHIEPWQMTLSDDSVARRLAAKRDYLQDVARRISLHHDVKVKTVLVDMDSTSHGVNFAAEEIDLVVMASRRLSRFRSLWSLSVADEIRRQLDRPVLLVRGANAAVDFAAIPSTKHLLLPLDGTIASERILLPAVALRRKTDTSLTLLNVQDRDLSRGSFVHDSPSGYLVGIAKMVRAEIPSVKAQMLVTTDDVALAIMDYAKRHAVDVIAVTTKNRHACSRLFRPGVADALVRNSRLPILLLGPAPKDDFPQLLTVFPQYVEQAT